MGGSAAPSAGETTWQSIMDFAHALPGLSKAMGNPSTVQNFSNATNEALGGTAPYANQLQQQLYNTYGPQIANTQNQIGSIGAQGNSQITANQVNSPQASQIVQGATNLSQQANPQLYNLLNTYSGGINNAMNNLSPTMNGSQLSGIMRNNATSGVANGSVNVPTAISTAANAMNFGQAGQAQATNFANTLNSMVSNLSQFNTNPNTFSQVTGTNPSAANANTQAAGMFQGVTGNTQSGQNNATSSGLLNNIFNNTMQTTAINKPQGINNDMPPVNISG